MRRVVFVLAALVAACTSAATRERERLTRELGRDPVQTLRAIGSAPSADAARELKGALREELTGQQELDLLRFGYGSNDELVVLGATALSTGNDLAVPEMRNAAALLIPRLADPDCSGLIEQAVPLIGSVDMPATAAPIRAMPARQAWWVLGALHRMVRADAIPSLCELALATTGAVRGGAFDNASMAASYSDEHAPLLIATWLHMHGVAPESDSSGLPGVLRTALHVHLDLPEPPPPPPDGQPDERDPELPQISCMRWLLASRAAPEDLPLLRRLVDKGGRELRHGALWALGGMTDDASLQLLRGQPTDDESVLLARARRGDAPTDVIEKLLAERTWRSGIGFAAASPARRRAFCERLLLAPCEEALEDIAVIAASSYPGNWWYGVPPYADEYFADLEPLAAAAQNLDARVLRSLVARVPSCATTRLADALLARPAAELFAADTDPPPAADMEIRVRELGYAGVWAFLEVTRPEAFRLRLREGLRCEPGYARDLAAALLLRIGDDRHHPELVAWLERSDDAEHGWLLLARDRHPKVIAELRTRLASATENDDIDLLAKALGTALGMPFEFAGGWEVPEDAREEIRTALLAGDAGGAFLISARDTEDLDWSWPRLAKWAAPAVQTFLRERRSVAQEDADTLNRYDLRWALHANDRAVLTAAMTLVRDGRYATHYGIDEEVRAHAEGLAMLPFWIDEFGTNCCRAVVAEEVMTQLFGGDEDAYRGRHGEPTRTRLRRRLLPVAHRLKWSRIADCYVVAGE